MFFPNQHSLAVTSRTRRFVGGLSLGYLHTVVMTVVGLWLTPYLLRHLGERSYGLWLLGSQILGYLALMDLGIVALLPREVAYATGRAGGDRFEELPQLVGETARLVLWQTPAVAISAMAVWWLIPLEWSSLRWPLGIVILTFVVLFPLRVFHAVLQGLQDLPFISGAQIAAWTLSTALTIGLVQVGFGLYSLAAGWVLMQTALAGFAWYRLARDFPHALPKMLPLSLSAVRRQMGSGVWISVSQIAQVLLNGTDLLVIGKLLGPAAVVPYACTGKLLTLLAHQPQLLMQMAQPALSELRAGAPRERLFEVSSGLAQMMLLASGAIVCVVLAVNESFVTWWVGASRYGGHGLTALMLCGMLLRHWNTTAVYALFCFGYERRLALTAVADGLITLIAMILLIPWFGLKGAVLGSIAGTCAVSLPSNLRALAREQGVRVAASIKPLQRWAIRFAMIVVMIGVVTTIMPTGGGLRTFALLAIVVVTVYSACMLPVLLTPPSSRLLIDRLKPWLSLVPGLSRRLIGADAA